MPLPATFALKKHLLHRAPVVIAKSIGTHVTSFLEIKFHFQANKGGSGREIIIAIYNISTELLFHFHYSPPLI